MQYGTLELDCGDILPIVNIRLDQGRILMEAILRGPHAKATINSCTVRGVDGLIIGIQELLSEIPEMDANKGFTICLGWEFNLPSFDEELSRIIDSTKDVATDLEARVSKMIPPRPRHKR